MMVAAYETIRTNKHLGKQMETTEIVELLRQKTREHKQEARRCEAAVRALLEPQKPQGRPPVNPKRELYEAIKQSGLTYAEIATEVGVSYRYVSWVARAKINRPELETRIREVLAVHAGGSSVISAQQAAAKASRGIPRSPATTTTN